MTDRRTVVLERTYRASPADVWEMWTTVEGIESWWGPDGFCVEVHEIEVTVGGVLDYSMKTVGPDQTDYMKQAGMPLATRHSIVFTEVVPERLLAYRHMADFIPGVDAYEVGHRVELTPTEDGTKLTLTIDAMHDQHWTDLAVAGWESELERLRTAVTRKEHP